MKKAKRYPWDVASAVNKRLPREILNALSRTGWNAFGIYEVIKEELRKNKTKVKP